MFLSQQKKESGRGTTKKLFDRKVKKRPHSCMMSTEDNDDNVVSNSMPEAPTFGIQNTVNNSYYSEIACEVAYCDMKKEPVKNQRDSSE
jgi:hypothetical protein